MIACKIQVTEECERQTVGYSETNSLASVSNTFTPAVLHLKQDLTEGFQTNCSPKSLKLAVLSKNNLSLTGFFSNWVKKAKQRGKFVDASVSEQNGPTFNL